jgi:hypothetical protein
MARVPPRAWVTALLAAAAAVLLAAVAVVVAHVANRKTEPAVHSLRFTTPQVRSWSGVGPGWTVALWAAAPRSDRYTIYLVSPDGQRTAVGSLSQLSTPEFAGVSPDNSRVAILGRPGLGPMNLVVVDLRTRTQHQFVVPDGDDFVGFATADGRLLRIATADGSTKLVDTAGRVRSVRPQTAADNALATATGARMAVTIDGRTAIVDSARRILVETPDGTVLTTLPLPPGGGCLAIEPWNDLSIVVQCNSGIFAVPLDGGRAVQLAKPLSGVDVGPRATRYAYRLYDVVRVAGRVYGVEVPSCGANDRISLVADEGVARPVQERGAPVVGAITGHTDDSFYFVRMKGCQVLGGTLYRYSPAEHKIVALLGGAGHGGGVVLGAWTIEAAAPGDHRPAF